jgi:hypothetical protein
MSHQMVLVPKVVIELSGFLLLIWDVMGSDLDPEAGYPVFRVRLSYRFHVFVDSLNRAVYNRDRVNLSGVALGLLPDRAALGSPHSARAVRFA